MEQKALEKGMSGHLQGLELLALSPIAGGKADQPLAAIDDAGIGDGYAMCVAPEILDAGLRSWEGALGVDDPVLRIEMIEQPCEAHLGAQVGRILVQGQGVGKCGLLEGLQKLAPEDLAQGFDREEKLRGGLVPSASRPRRAPHRARVRGGESGAATFGPRYGGP